MGLALKPRLLILDEPTQGLVGRRDRQLHRAGARDRREAHGAADRAQHGRGHGAWPTGSPCSTPAASSPKARPRRSAPTRPCRPPISGTAMADRSRSAASTASTATSRCCAAYRSRLRRGEVLCLLGRNGAGKTTAAQGDHGPGPGRRRHDQARRAGDLTGLPAHEVPQRGVAYVPQGRRLFAELTVAENIEIGLMARGTGRATREAVLALFPVLRERLAPARRHAVRRRAADAGDGPRALASSPRCCCSTSRPKG